MAASSAGFSGLAARYAAALFELADEQKALDQVANDLRQLRTMIAGSSDLQRLIRSPILSRAAQGRAVAEIATQAGLSPLTRNFLGLAAQNRRLFVAPAIIEAFLAILAERRGEVTAQVTAAQPLTDAQQALVEEQLRRAVGSKVAVEIKVDPSLLGGMIVQVGSRMVDASLKSKLHRLEAAMKGA